MAYTRRVKKSVRIRGLAPLLACFIFAGCMNDVTAPPEGTDLLWKNAAFPGRQRINCIAIDPDQRIFMGVYEYEREVTRNVGEICFSPDNGETWTKKELGSFEIVNLAIDSEGRIFAEGYARIARSQDHGESWEILSYRLNSQGWINIVVDAGDNLYLWTSFNGIYFSGDHGDSWTKIDGGIVAAGEMTSFAMNSRGCLFAVAGQRLYVSRDRGASWTEAPDVPWERSNGIGVAIDSRDRIFVNNYLGLYRSADDGETWTAAAPLSEYTMINEITIDGKDRLCALSFSSLYVSDSGGDGWALVLTLGHTLHDVASNAAGDLFATGSCGLNRSIDGGASWEMLGFSEYLPADMAVDGKGYCYVGLASGGVYRSIDSLDTWKRFSAGLPDITLNCLASAGESMLIAGTSSGLYVSPADRPAWSFLGLDDRNVGKVFAFSRDSVVAFSNSLLISTDAGGSWRDIGLGGYEIKALIRTADGSLLAGANFGGVFRYTGEGILWDQMNAGLGDLRVNALAVARGGDILAGTDGGIFVSSNGGASWRRFAKEQIRITAALVVDEDIFFGGKTGIFWTRTDGAALSMQNDGITIAGEGAGISMAADPRDRLFLFFDRKVYRSSQSTKELSPSGL